MPPINVYARQNTSATGFLRSNPDQEQNMYVKNETVKRSTTFSPAGVQTRPDGLVNDIAPGHHRPEWIKHNSDPSTGHKQAFKPGSAPPHLENRAFEQNENNLTSNVTYIIVGIAAVLIVITIIAFVFMRRRRNSVPRKLLMPVSDDKKLEFRNAIVTYKAEEECLGLEQRFDASEDSLGKMNPNFILDPRYIIINNPGTINGGVIPITSEGGLYKCPDSDIYVSIPHKLTTTNIKQICVVSGPPRNLPYDTNPENVLSDMITLLPHNTNLDTHVLVCFPVHMSKVADVTKIQLLYSNTDPGDEPHWVNLQQCQTPTKHSDDVCWFINEGYCYLYASHFCHVFLTQHCTLIEQPAVFLQASVHGEYLPKDNKLLIKVGFHCSKCNPGLLHKKHAWGGLLGSGFRCIYGKEGEVMVNLQLDPNKWKGVSHNKEVDADDLMNLCNLNDIYPPLTFTYRCNKQSTAVNVDEDALMFRVCVSQGARKPFIMEGDEEIYKLINHSISNKTVIRFERTSGPEENADESLEPVENTDNITNLNDAAFIDENANVNLSQHASCRSYEERQNDENSNRESGSFEQPMCNGWRRDGLDRNGNDPCENDVSSVVISDVINEQVKQELPDDKQLVPYQPKDDCVFNQHVREEQVKLCALLEPKKKDSSVILMKEISETPTIIDNKNFSGHMILQMWNIKVKMNQRTWAKLYHILTELKMERIAKQLKVTFDKDKLICALEDFKINLQMEPLLTQLLSRGIVTPFDVREMRSQSNMIEGKWLEYLVYNVLNKQPVAKLYGFYEVVQRLGEHHKTLVNPLQLCPTIEGNYVM